MARDTTRLTDDAVATWLKAHPKWERSGTQLRRTFEFPLFLAGIDFVHTDLANLCDAAVGF